MPWNRKTTRRDRKRRARRGDTARGRRARERDLQFWSDYYRPIIRREIEFVLNSIVASVDTPPPAVP